MLLAPTLFTLLTHHTHFTQCDVAIGIDLGTTFSCLRGYDSNSKKLLVPDIDGHDTYPSVVAYDKMKVNEHTRFHPITGHRAIAHNNVTPNSANFFYAVKRLIGLTVKDLSNDKLKDLDNKVTYKVIKNKDNTITLKNVIDGDVRYVRPIDISSCILKDLYVHAVKMAKGAAISKCVITVPAYFTENQVTATGRAAELAGLKMDKTLNEPVAAAYAYQKNRSSDKSDIYLIVDFGGGTLDISLLEHEDGILEVKTYSGNNFLGGENVNDLLFNHFINLLKTNANYDVTDETEKLSLRSFIEEFKIALCTKQNEEDDSAKAKAKDCEHEKVWYYGNGKSMSFVMKTSEFNKVCMPVFEQVRNFLNGKDEGIVDKYVQMGGKIESINKVLFVGGSSRIPYIRKMVAGIFKNSTMDFTLDADTCVAEGAAYFAASSAGYFGEDGLHLVDVVPIPIGICVGTDEYVRILDSEKAVPASGTRIFTTQHDNQTQVNIKVAQGMRYAYKDNDELGSFNLSITKPAPRGVPQIEVTIHMDKDRTIRVSAKDLATGEQQKIEYKSDDYASSDKEHAAMKAKAEAFAEVDKALAERYDAKKDLEAYVEKVRLDMQNMSIDVKSDVELHLTSAENWLNTEKETADADMIRAELEKLKEVVGSILEPGRAQEVPKEDVREEL